MMRSLKKKLCRFFKMADSKISKSMARVELEESVEVVNILNLPNEILVQIIIKLAQDDILKGVALVCKRFLEVTRLPKMLQIINIPCLGYFEEDLPRIQNCLAIYPKSLLYIDDLEIKLSLGHLEVLESVAPSIQRLKITVDFDMDFAYPPLFQNIKVLELDDIDYLEDDFDLHGIGFWKQFPNLTALRLNLTSHYSKNTDVSCISFIFIVKWSVFSPLIILFFQLVHYKSHG